MRLQSTGELIASEFQEYSMWDSDILADNLVVNGTPDLGNNYNFSTFTYDPDPFLYVTSGSVTRLSNLFIPVDKDCAYAGQGEFKNGNPGNPGRFYYGVACYDKDLVFIDHREVNHYVNTQTTLAADLNNGDSVVYLTDATNWKTSANVVSQRFLAVWYGQDYPDYTRTKLWRAYADSEAVTHTVTLSAQWNGGLVPAGTPVANALSGSTYNYRYASNVWAPDDWTTYGGLSHTMTGWFINNNDQFRYGTEYIKLLFLLNRNASPATTTTHVRNLKFWNVTKTERFQTEFDIVRLGTSDIFKSFEFIETKRRKSPMAYEYTSWAVGTTGSQTGFTRIGSDAENEIIEAEDPWGKLVPVWQALPDAVSGPDGGWNSASFPIDHTKMYRFSVWVNRKVLGNGSFYLGLYGYNAGGSNIGTYRRSDGAKHTNYYFYSGTIPEDVWVLVVGHVWPSGSGIGDNHVDSGRYYVTGEKYGAIGLDCVWMNDPSGDGVNARSLHRSYLYYSTNTDTRQQWCYPRVDIVDGSEPSISELICGFDSRLLEYTLNLPGNDNQYLSVRETEVFLSFMDEVS